MIETIIQNLVDQLSNWMAAIGPFGPLLMAIAILGTSLVVVQFAVETTAKLLGLY